MTPKIDNIEQSNKTPFVDRPTARGLDVSSSGAALQNLGQAIGVYGEQQQKILEQQAEEDGKAWASKAISDFHLSTSQQVNDVWNNLPEGKDAVPEIQTRLDKLRENFSSQAPTRYARTFFDDHANSIYTNTLTKSIERQADYNVQKRFVQYEDGVKSSNQLVFSDPSLLLSEKARLKETMPTLPPELRIKADQAINSLDMAAANGLIERDPKQFLDIALPKNIQTSTKITGEFPLTLTQYKGDIESAASQYGVDPLFLARQLHAESAGNPKAINNADIAVTGSPSIGIAQFQPATAKELGIDPKDPQQSIVGQAKYMRQLLDKYGGDYAKSATAYNWGMGNLDKLIAQKGDNWRAFIPESTSNYIDKIGIGAGTMIPVEVLDKAKANNPLLSNMSGEQIAVLVNKAQSAVNQKSSVAKNQLSQYGQNATAALMMGDIAPPLPPQSLYTDAYGDQAATMMKEHAIISSASHVANSLKNMSPMDGMNSVNAFRPTNTADPNYADQAQVYEKLGSAWRNILKQREDDPAAYVNSLPEMKQAFQQFNQSQTPEAAAAYRDQLFATQDRLGLQRTLLSKNIVDHYVNLLSNQDTPAESVKNTINHLKSTWASSWPMVAGQLQASGKLSGDILTISGMNPTSAMADKLASASRIPLSELTKGFEKNNKDAQSNLNAKLQVAANSFALQGGDGNSTFIKLTDSAKKLTAVLIREGMSDSDAATKAYSAIFDEKYNFGDTYRVPKKKDDGSPNGLNFELIQERSRNLLDLGITEKDIQPFPASILGVAPEAAANLSFSALKKDMAWRTNREETGLQLMIKGKDGVLYPVKSPNGLEIEKTWKQLSVDVVETDPREKTFRIFQ